MCEACVVGQGGMGATAKFWGPEGVAVGERVVVDMTGGAALGDFS